MRIKRIGLVAGGCIALVWLLIDWAVSGPSAPAGGLVVTFAGLTNDPAGGKWAQFKVSNCFPRRVTFGIGEAQVRDTNGWPSSMRVANGAAWIPVKAGSEKLFSVSAGPLQGVTWRVPLMYAQDLSLLDNVRFRIDGIAWALPRLRPGRPLPVRNGSPFHRSFFTFSPEINRASDSPLPVDPAQ